jgi:putative transposase
MRAAAAPGTFGRDASAPSFLDEAHLAAALAYVAPNPVRARLAARARDWRWASTRAHLSGRDDGMTALAPIRARIPDFAAFLAGGEDAEAIGRLRAAESIGRPLGDDRFLAAIERSTARNLRPGKRGPKPRAQDGN